MPNLVLNTCGTSLLTNGAGGELRNKLIKNSNKGSIEDIAKEDAAEFQQLLSCREKSLLAAGEEEARRMSAELNALLSWHQGRAPQQRDIYILLATDTFLGRESAAILKKWLEAWGCNDVRVMSQHGLRTDSLQGFRESLPGLVKELSELLEAHRASGDRICFNLTGGFKSLNGFIQTLATIHADETFYLFDHSSDLVFIPRLPFSLNATEWMKDHLAVFRRLHAGLECKTEEVEKLPETLIFNVDEQYMLSEWGELLWSQAWKEIYRQDLLPSISERIVFSGSFAATVKGKSPELTRIINKAVDELAKYAESDCTAALNSLDPKPLQGKHWKKEGLWECDLDGNHRIFMIPLDGYRFELQTVGPALH